MSNAITKQITFLKPKTGVHKQVDNVNIEMGIQLL